MLCTTSSSAYDTLGVPRDAKAAEIRARYLELAKATHPDASGSKSGGFAEISAAYDVLSDPERRAQHDLDLERRQRSHVPEVLATALTLASRGRVLAATAAFLSLEGEMHHTASDSAAKVELARALLDLSANSAPLEPATHAQVAQLWKWLLTQDAVDASACNAWFALCLNRGHHIEAMRAYKHAQRESLEQVSCRRVTHATAGRPIRCLTMTPSRWQWHADAAPHRPRVQSPRMVSTVRQVRQWMKTSAGGGGGSGG